MRIPVTLLSLALLFACRPRAFEGISGFKAESNKQLVGLFERYRDYTGRKIAVFDGDGTVLGQVPHYLADECMYEHAEVASVSPEKRKILEKLAPLSNVSIPYVIGRVEYFSGQSLQSLRETGQRCFDLYYKNKMYAPMKALAGELQRQGFEVWIVTASPEALYQGFLSRELGIPVTRIIGVKSEVQHGLTTNTIVQPVPQDAGKQHAIETFIQDRPQLVGGNSRGDREMIEYSSDLKMIINPDQHISEGDTESMADYARREGWLVERVRDVKEEGFPGISAKQWKVRENRPRE